MRRVVMAGVFMWCCGAGAQPARSFVPMSPAIQADRDAMTKMMAHMDAPYSGNADRDFVTHMIGQHQGGIDMAQVELTYGTDPKMRAVAKGIIAAQQREIAQMQAWLAAHPAREFHPANPHIQWK